MSLKNLQYRKIGAQGNFISGGEKEKISLCRFLSKQEDHFFILDEPFTNVDVITERLCLDLLHKELQNKSGLLISHKLNVVKELADIIIVLQDGAIIETGTHNQLLQTCNKYSQLYNQYLAQTEADHQEMSMRNSKQSGFSKKGDRD